MPALGFGVFQTPPDETIGAVEAALAVGYRHIDTAAAYGNEREVGEGIRRSGLDRSDVFVETKVWISDYGYDETLHAFDKSAAKLGVEQIDLLILHQPLPSEFDRTIAAYQALETLLADGQGARDRRQQLPARAPRVAAGAGGGRSRRQPDRGAPVLHAGRRLRELHARARHPDPGVVADRRHHVLPRRHAEAHVRRPDHPRASRDAHGKSAAQVMLRWHLQQGRSRDPEVGHGPSASPRTSTSSTSSSATDELAAIDALDTGVRGGPEPADVNLENFGRPIPERMRSAASNLLP